MTFRAAERCTVDPDTGLLLEETHKIRGHGQDVPADRWTWLEAGPANHTG